MMDLHLLIQRLKDVVIDLKVVGGSADLPTAQSQLRTTPAAFVVPSRESAEPNTLAANAISQKVNVQFGVAIAVRDVSDATGLASHQALAPIRSLIKCALLGWQPSQELEPITYLGGALLLLDDGVLWWFDEFETAYFERVVQ